MRTREEPQNARIRQMAAPRLPVIRMALADRDRENGGERGS
jgi:hypothetical protein